MDDDKTKRELPTLTTPIQRHPPVEHLAGALTKILRRPQWGGVPNNSAIAAALRNILADEDPATLWSRRGRVEFMHSLIEALETGTADGWALKLNGPKGPRKNFTAADREFEIGEFVAERVAAGDGYLSAIYAAAAEFECGITSAAAAYRLIKAMARGI